MDLHWEALSSEIDVPITYVQLVGNWSKLNISIVEIIKSFNYFEEYLIL